MHTNQFATLVMIVLGGLALFIFGMKTMTEGLRSAAGDRLRTLLSRATKNRWTGITLGAVLGFLMQSGATTVMLVGFIHAGLITLVQAIPTILGANIGTTLSMQLISFHVGDYCYLPIFVGFVLYMSAAVPALRQSGLAILGFGLMFLAMNIISHAVLPYRDLLKPMLTFGNAHHMGNMIIGMGISMLVTVLLQSSSATIGICFALISAGVFTQLNQVYPLVLGAHIGTCSTALISSMGTSANARRAALSHLLFNVFGTIFGLLAAPLFLKWIPYTAVDLVHQTANVHTFVMLLAALLAVPFTPLLARLAERLIPSKEKTPTLTYLDKKLLDFPEQAICTAIRELQRVAQLCEKNFWLVAEVIFKPDHKKVRAIKLNEFSVDSIKASMKDYLAAMASRYLSRRQAIIIQHINRCMIDIERIGDHIDAMCDLSIKRWKTDKVRFNRDAVDALSTLFKAANKVLHLVIESLNPENTDFHAMARAILEARDDYVEKSLSIKSMFTEKIAAHEYSPIVGIYLSEYVGGFDRLVRHSKMIALAESHPYFWIKRHKLSRHAPEAPYIPPPPEDSRDFLDELQREGYV